MARVRGAVPTPREGCGCGVDRFGSQRRSLGSRRASSLGSSAAGRLGIYCRLADALPLADPDRTTVGRSGRGASGFEACFFIGLPPRWSTSHEQGWSTSRKRRSTSSVANEIPRRIPPLGIRRGAKITDASHRILAFRSVKPPIRTGRLRPHRQFHAQHWCSKRSVFRDQAVRHPRHAPSPETGRCWG